MRFLAFLLLGTLIFGFAFPAFILFVGLFAMILVGVLAYNAMRGGTFRVYTNRGGGYQRNPFGARRESPPEDPEVIGEDAGSRANYAEPEGQPDEQDGEVVELPASALRKDDE